jgi:transcriptional regulator with XRE-family HTH domain
MLVPKRSEICRLRTEAGLSLKKLSELAGLPSNAVFRIEKTKTGYTHPIRARAIAAALDCDLEKIFDNVPGK